MILIITIMVVITVIAVIALIVIIAINNIMILSEDADPSHLTAAIGDGGNDVSMLQEAHVGLAIIGDDDDDDDDYEDEYEVNYKDVEE